MTEEPRDLDDLNEFLDGEGPDDTGLGVSGMSVAPLEALDGPCERLIKRLDYSGAGNIQYLVDEASGAIAFLELNPMIGGNHGLAYHCGLDQANGLLDVVLGRHLERWDAEVSYPVGKRYAWFLGDIYGLVQGLELRQVSGTQAVRWMLRALASGLTAPSHIIWRWDDPLPALYLGCKAMLPLSLRAARQSARILVQRSKAITGHVARGAG